VSGVRKEGDPGPRKEELVPVYPRRRQVKRRAGMRGGKYIIPAPSHLQELQQDVNQHDDDDEPHQEPYYVLHVFSSASWLPSMLDPGCFVIVTPDDASPTT
jgi:hypothetical protein